MPDGEPRTRRLFVGIELGATVRAACVSAGEALRKTGFDAKYESAEKLHVTLAFLGNVDPGRFEPIAAALATASAAAAPFAIRLDKLAAFPHERKPRVVYVGARDQGEAFRWLSAAVREALAPLGFTFDDDAVAHVTIARVKDPRRALPLVELPPIPLAVEAIAVFESLFDKECNTSRYEVIAAAKLG